jgi:Tol biopolymer transport system component
MSSRSAARSWSAVAVAVVAAASLSGGAAAREPARQAPTAATVIRLPPGWQMNKMGVGPTRTEAALSRDASFVIFSATPDGTMPKTLLHRRSLDSEEVVVYPGTEGACMPVISPDGQWIGFWANGKLLKVAVKGGPPVVVCDLPARPLGLCWGPDGRIIFGTLNTAGGLRRVSADGGTPETLTTVDASKESSHRLPQWLPGGKALVFTVMRFQFGMDARVEGLSLETGARKVLIEDGADARYVSSGHLVFVRRGTLMAAPFSPDRLEVTGPAVAVRTGLMQAFNAFQMPDTNSGAGQYAVSESGALLSVSGGIYPEQVADLYWLDRSGRAEKWTAFGTRSVMGIRLSPDGRQLALTTGGVNASLSVYDIGRNATSRLTSGGLPWSPLWTPDGKRLVFSWGRTGSPEMWWTPSNGSGKPERLTTSDADQRASCLTRDGRYLAYVEVGRGTASDIHVLRMADRQVTPFAVSKSNEVLPEFSPDGLWIAYASNESGRNEIYARSFPDGKMTLPISSEGGVAPMWSPDGRELFYWNIEFTKLMKVDVAPGRNLSAGTPKPLFEFAAAPSANVRNYDITPDGRRFLIREKKETVLPPVTELSLVRNWFGELKRLSPATK